MNYSRREVPDHSAPIAPSPARRQNVPGWILLALLLTVCAARADGPDDDYLGIYSLINQADTLNAGGNTGQAHAKYLEAQKALAAFQKDYPDWNTKTVAYRMSYLAGKIETTSEKAAPATNAAAPVKLLAAGTGPQKALRLHPAVGDKQTLSLTMKTSIALSAAGQTMPAMNLPALVMTIELEVKEVAADGEITFATVLGEAAVAADSDAAPAMTAAAQKSLAGLGGITGAGRMSQRGIIRDFEMKPPADANPQSKQTTDQMRDFFMGAATALPEEAVGPGAKWKYKKRVKSGGMTVDETMTYELVSSDGDHVILHSTLTQSAANQKIDSPAMPGMKVDLDKLTGEGAGETTLDLGKIMPVRLSADEKTEINMGMNVGEQKQSMATTMNAAIRLESK